MVVKARMQYDDRCVFDSDVDFSKDPGVTKQADALDCDINTIFKKFEKSGQLPNMIARNPSYGDFSEVPDYQEALNIVRHAEEQFLNLDASIRNEFENDPAKFLAFATDEKNYDRMEKMGLLSADKVAARRQAAAERDLILREQGKAEDAKRERELIDRIKAELAK